MKKVSLMTALLFALCLLSSCGGGSPTLAPSAPLAITSGAPPSGETGNAYAGAAGFSFVASGGVAPYKWNWAPATGSSVPVGLTLAGNLLSGTPTASGIYVIVVTVTDSASPAAHVGVNYSVSIDMPLAITSDDPPGGTVGVQYGVLGTEYLRCILSPVFGWHVSCVPCDPNLADSCPITPCVHRVGLKPCTEIQQVPVGFTFSAGGGAAPYTWTATGLPPGLNLDLTSGNISGTPTTAGSYSVSVAVSDSESLPAQVTMTYAVGIDGASLQK
jgi:large repetitive protein